MRILALLMYATAVVCTTLAFSGSFETARTEEINGVIRVSDGLVMIGLSEKYDEPYIETLVLKIDFSGEVLWVEEYGTPGDDVGRCLTVTGEGNILLVSRVENAGSARPMATLVEEDGDQIWQKFYGKNRDYLPWKACITRDGFLIAGQCLTDKNYFQAFLIKTGSSGKLLWERDFRKRNLDAALDVSTDLSGSIFLTGYSWKDDSQSLWLALLDQSGKTAW
ncbi:hypothetical protein DS66_09035 [Mesotoga sp. SC_3PWM13N19]|nr:hypothetical protein DS66_09035 [Mesotoga sp. SC_3PWM13N19]